MSKLRALWQKVRPYSRKVKWAFIGTGISLGMQVLQDPDMLDLIDEIPDIGPVNTNTWIKLLIPAALAWLVKEKVIADKNSGAVEAAIIEGP
jgi:hypothetical protein